MQPWYCVIVPRSARSVAWLAVIAVFAISLLVLVGTALNIKLFTSIESGWTAMRVITAICLALSAMELALLQTKESRVGNRSTAPAGTAPGHCHSRLDRESSLSVLSRSMALQLPGILVGLVSLLTIALYIIRMTTGREPSLGNSALLNLIWAPDSRMAMLTAIIFVFITCALALLATGARRAANVAHALILPAAVAAYLIPVSYILNTQNMHGLLNLPVALNTGIAFCLLFVAIFCVRPDTWLMSSVTGSHAGGVMARRLLPALLGLPLVITWMHRYGEQTGVVGSEVGVAVVAVAVTVCLLWLAWLSARSINRTDEKLREREESLRETNRRLALLSETASQLLVTEDPQALVQSLCEKVMAHLDCHAFFNFLADEERGCLRLSACAGIPEDVARSIEWLEYGTAVCGCAARDGCRIIAEDIFNTPDPRTELVKTFGIQAYACHPLYGQGGRVMGTLSFGSRTKDHFAEDDISLMKTVTDQVATALERKRSIQREREMEAHKIEFYRHTILAATQGRLLLTDRAEVERIAGEPIASWSLSRLEDLPAIRNMAVEIAKSAGMQGDQLLGFLSCVGEATSNAFAHAGGGEASIHGSNGQLMFMMTDKGPGIAAINLPDVALVEGYTTAGTMGMGYKLMMASSDKVYLATGPEGTAVAVQIKLDKARTARTLPNPWF